MCAECHEGWLNIPRCFEAGLPLKMLDLLVLKHSTPCDMLRFELLGFTRTKLIAIPNVYNNCTKWECRYILVSAAKIFLNTIRGFQRRGFPLLIVFGGSVTKLSTPRATRERTRGVKKRIKRKLKSYGLSCSSRKQISLRQIRWAIASTHTEKWVVRC